ncbi:PASTA domain-containing protein [Marinobacterium sedimentorum]|uniref:PASTA domain-containing protein n=1 Tax=Marinobacterium sedimentorum TaxID=2927804 RepID=UPI0020C6327E|nr:PASTA domain-containing protein [Marinobacterium sedimentorum]MCP8688867.1 PASTA domain-containing protein [Marinobacterium sedimentorum]
MATSIVTIDAPDKVVSCDEKGAAQQLFNVRNISGHPITVGAKVLVDKATQANWLRIEAPAELEMGDNVLTQIPVRIQVPADCEPGRYSYRLLVYSARKSGEEFTEGETVAIEVPAKKAPPPSAPPKPSYTKWIAVLVAILLIGGAVTWYFLPKSVDVPDVVGIPLDQARAVLEDAGLGVSMPVASKASREAPDSVLEQMPVAGSEVEKGSAVQLTIAEKLLIKVPGVTNVRLATALQRLSSAGLGLGAVAEKVDDSKPVGTVLEQQPGQNASVEEGTAVNLVVSREKGKVLVLDRAQLSILKGLQLNQRMKIPAALLREVAPEDSPLVE